MKVIINEHLTDEELNNFEKRIRHGRKLKIHNREQNYYQNSPFLEGLHQIFLDLITYNTLYAKNNLIQCCANRRRSQKDLYNIVRYYYPEVSFKEFRSALFTLCNRRYIGTLYCSDIRKRVFRKNNRGLYSDFYENHLMSDKQKDELGLYLNTSTITDEKYTKLYT